MASGIRKPVLIIPGFMSSGLQVVSSEHKPGWRGKRVWLSVHRLGLTGKAFASSTEVQVDDDEVITVKNDWVAHLALDASDLTSERPGVNVRPLPGLGGVDFLEENVFAKSQSYVFAPVIRVLRRNGYTKSKDLEAAPYDWRLPPAELERRDRYFSRTLDLLDRLYRENGQTKVVVLAHSMGGLIAHYFFNFVVRTVGRAWLDERLDTFFALGVPHLGSAQAVRSILIGNQMGLPKTFLNPHMALVLGRSLGSGPLLLPVRRDGSCHEMVDQVDDDGFALFEHHGVLRLALRSVNVASLSYVAKRFRVVVRVGYGADKFQSQWFDTAFGEVPILGACKEDRQWVLQFRVPPELDTAKNLPIEISLEGGMHIAVLHDAKSTVHSVGSSLSTTLGISHQHRQKARGMFEKSFDGARSAASVTACSTRFTLASAVPAYTPETWQPINVQLARTGKAQSADAALSMMVCLKVPGGGPRYERITPLNMLLREGGLDTHAALLTQTYMSDPLLRRDAPPVNKVVAVYGVNVDTEVHQIFRCPTTELRSDKLQSAVELCTDLQAPGELGLKKHGLVVKNGIVYETSATPQGSKSSSGDGTVYYQSLRHVDTWSSSSCDVQIHELDGAKHREILTDKNFHKILLDVCVGDEEHTLDSIYGQESIASDLATDEKPEESGLFEGLSQDIRAQAIENMASLKAEQEQLAAWAKESHPSGVQLDLFLPTDPPDPPQPQMSNQVVSQSSLTTVQVAVPAGVAPGMTFQIQVNQSTFSITCPPNVRPGDSLQIQVPIAASTPPPPPPPPPAPVQKYQVVIPPGVGPGQTFQVSINSKSYSIQCPATSKQGDKIEFSV